VIPRPDFKRVRQRILKALNEQPGKAFTINQLQGACAESYDLIDEVTKYLANKTKEIKTHPQGGFCIGVPVREQAAVRGDGIDEVTQEIRELYKSEVHKSNQPLPELGQ
jgi:Fe2+ transport system protein B